MIWFYSGTPGSGKSLDVARLMLLKLRHGQPIISTVNIDLDFVGKSGKIKKIGKFTYIPITEINPEWLYRYAYKNHRKGKESQTLVILDECQLIFNPREFGRSGRLEWINFFTQHRHLGYDFILVSQFDRLIDRQIRSLFEYEVKHRKINNFKWLWILPFKVFVRITVWYGMKEKINSEFFIYNKKYSKVYDSFAMFENFADEFADEEPLDEQSDSGDCGNGGQGAPPLTQPPESERKC